MTAKKIIPKVLIVALVVGFGVLCACTGSIQSPVGTLWSLFPPVVAIGLALLTKEVYSSLFVGIVVGGLLATKFKLTSKSRIPISDSILTLSISSGIPLLDTTFIKSA